jgi:hypothetical protein
MSKFDESNRPREFISGHNPPNRKAQLAFLKAAGDGCNIREIATRTGQSLQAAKCMASKLVQQNKLKRIARGIYGNTNWHPVV